MHQNQTSIFLSFQLLETEKITHCTALKQITTMIHPSLNETHLKESWQAVGNYCKSPDDEFIGQIHDDLRTGFGMNSQCFSEQNFL